MNEIEIPQHSTEKTELLLCDFQVMSDDGILSEPAHVF
jgi:hypothetical protein